MAKKRMKTESPVATGFRVSQKVRVCNDLTTLTTLGRDKSKFAGEEGWVRFVNRMDEIGVELINGNGVFTFPSSVLISV